MCIYHWATGLPIKIYALYLYILQTESPRDVQIDITPIASDIVEEVIDEVMRSTNKEPSVPAVVLDTMQSIYEEEEETHHVTDHHHLVVDKDGEKDKTISDDVEKLAGRQTSVSEIISNFEAAKDDSEKSVSPRTSPRRSVSPKDVDSSRITSSEEKSISEEESALDEETEVSNKEGDVVTISSVGDGRTDNTVTVSNKREMEIQAIKVRIDDDEEPVASTNIDDVITINGQPVPTASTVVINGHVTRIQNTPQRDVDKHRSPVREVGKDHSSERSVSRENSNSPLINRQKDYRKDSKGFIQQTDLDTFETKITNDVEPLEVSNPDDDSSDQRSDTGSVNTVDSIDKEEKTENNVTVTNKRRLKNRNVSRHLLCE